MAASSAALARVALVVGIALMAMPLCVRGDALYFQLMNAAVPSQYQSVLLRFTGWSALNEDPMNQPGDWFYVVPISTATCGTSTTSTRYFVTVPPSNSSADAEIVIDPDIFVLGTSYAACYVSTQTNIGYLAKNSVIVDNTVVEVSFTVFGAIYQAYTLVSPTTVFAGQGPVSLTITEENVAGRPLNQGVSGVRPFLVPCSPNCGNFVALANACRTATSTAVTFSTITGYTTTTLQGTFTAPQSPESSGYAICVPYCFSSGSCSPTSWTVVDNTALMIQPANPSVYSVSPSNPTVRMYATLNFTGLSLSASDRVRILVAGGSCSSSSAALLSNVNYNQQSVVFLNSSSSSLAFRSENLITTPIVGQVCYARGDNPTIFAPVFQASSSTSDFTVLPMQPSAFSASPASPALGQQFQATFTGTGLSSSTDSAYFVVSPFQTCTVTSPDLCDGSPSNTVFDCPLTGGSAPSCSLLVDSDTSTRLVLCACYKTAASNNHALVNNSVEVTSAGSTQYTANPYPVYAGQSTVIQFEGTGLGSGDTIKFIPSNADCATGQAVTNVSAYAMAVDNSQSVRFSVVGPGSLCLRICYLFAGSASWTVSRPRTSFSVDASCAASRFYIAPFTLSHTTNPVDVTSRVTVTSTISASSLPLTSFIVVPGNESCVLTACGSSGASCAAAASGGDYFSSLSGTTAYFSIGGTGRQVLCVSLGSTYIPTLLAASPLTYTFVSNSRNPTSFTAVPATWRVAMSDFNVTFLGAALNTTTDIIRAIANVSLLGGKAACPLEGAIVSTILTPSVFPSTSSAEATFALRGADTLATGSVVHLCYYQGLSGSRTSTYMGSVAVLAQNPQPYNASGTRRAGELITLTFARSSDGALSPGQDSITFFQYQVASQPPSCRCDDTTCSSAVQSFRVSVPTAGSTSALTSWRNPLGFDNHAADAVYVVCYSVFGAGSATYTGQLTILQSHPSYYTLASATLRVGLPMTITVSTLCSACAPLSSSDSIIIIFNSSDCADVSGMNSSFAEAVGPVSLTSPSTMRTLVPLVAGFYRVCYRKVNDTVFRELPFSTAFDRAPLLVSPADPAAFTPIPTNPTAGQYIVVNLTTCGAATCGSCGRLRIFSGAAASCWNASIAARATSRSCVGSSVLYEFPNSFLSAGAYTLCFGEDSATSRVPGTLTVLVANPATYSVTSASIFTNQGSPYVFTLSGSGLSSADSIFILPGINYTCHDLRDADLDIRRDSDYFAWWEPSTQRYNINVTTNSSARWTASDSNKRFKLPITTSTKFCSNVGVSCSLQLCYLRSGTSWAPVSGSTVALHPANPQKVVLDVTPSTRGQYALATVTGTGLSTGDYLYFANGACELLNVIGNATSPSSVTAGTTWQGVLRFSSSSSAVRGCYVSDGGRTITEVPDIHSFSIGSALLMYTRIAVWNASNRDGFLTHVATQYESANYAGTVSSVGATQVQNVASMYFVASTAECNYPSFAPANAYAVQTSMTRVASQTAFFFARTNVVGSIALCLWTAGGLLYRTVNAFNDLAASAIIIRAANPSSYTATPTHPLQEQTMTLTFQLSAGSQNITGDDVHVVLGSLDDCGLDNATVVISTRSLSLDGTVSFSIPNATNYTVCYRKYNGTAASVPRFGLRDRNLAVAALYPRYFSGSPLIPQQGVSLNISFFSNGTGPFTSSDRAYLVERSNSSILKPLPSDCLLPRAITATAISLVQSATSVWSISSAAMAALPIGNYTVCYILASNGQGSYVPLPGFLTIEERQSPFAFVTDSIGALSIFSGERVRIFFNTTVALSPALMWEANATQDAVAFSTTSSCTSLLTAAQVASIPLSFGYAATASAAPFVHVRFRASGNFFVCMRRFNRTANQQFFNFDAVGGPDSPAVLRVAAAPITLYATQPATPRALVPLVALALTFASGFTIGSFSNIFASPYENQTSASDVIAYDSCYLPPAGEASGSRQLNTTLMFTQPALTSVFPFPASQMYVLCYTVGGRRTASHPIPFFVGRPDPLHYSVPELVGPGATFQMTFTSQDGIFSSTRANAAVILVSNGSVNCASAAVAPGTTNFTGAASFTGNSTVAAVAPLITLQGTYFVCFRVFDQLQYAPVVNVAGGYTFGVGDVGPSSYSVAPVPSYAGQLLSLSIRGNVLRATDTAKVVNITALPPSTNYFSLCSLNSMSDANAVNPQSQSGAGQNISYSSSTAVALGARILRAGMYILCYRGAANAWQYVPELSMFTVQAPQPSHYITSPSTVYSSQPFNISVVSAAGRLLGTDEFRLVARGASSDGFDCHAAAAAALNVSLLSLSPQLGMWSSCSASAALLTVCYRLSNGTWSEVPASPSGAYAALQIAANPWDVRSVTVSTSPRPLETFTLLFSGPQSPLITRVVFTAYQGSACNRSNAETSPLFTALSPAAMQARSGLREAGTYTVLIATSQSSSLIALPTPLQVAPCDPCIFLPVVMFTGATYNLSFFSNHANTLSTQDAVRLIASSTSLAAPDACSSAASAFGSTTYVVSAANSNSSRVPIAVPDAGDGAYFVCYRKASSTDFAIVGSSFGVPLVLNVVLPEPAAATGCPAALSGLQSVSFTFSRRATQTLAPLSTNDAAFLVTPPATCDASPALWVRSLAMSFANDSTTSFDTVLPHVVGTAQTYRLCYRHTADSMPRSISTVTVRPSDPVDYVLAPTSINVGMSNVNITFRGVMLAAGDAVYFVDSSTSCEEFCRNRPLLLPTVAPPFVLDTSGAPSFTVARLSSPFTASGNISVCYRLASGTLARMPAQIVVAPANPSVYSVNFVARVGTRPALNFTGRDLSTADRAKIVFLGASCDSTGVALADLRSADQAGSWARYYLPLEGVAIGAYTVCYNVGSTGWVPVTPTFQVHAGGPTAFATSNAPMVARATVVTFPQQDFAAGPYGVGDTAIITCPTCSCWDDGPVSVAYGNASATVSSALSIAIRVGFNATVSGLRVCYRVADSGFASVGNTTFSVAAPRPVGASVAPAVPFQGQRLTVLLVSQTPLSLHDDIITVAPGRGCWDTPQMDPSRLLSAPANMTATTNGAAAVHFPSLGPGITVWSEALRFAICFREASQAEYVHVPFPLVLTAVAPADPTAVQTGVTVIRPGMINVSVRFSTLQPNASDVAYAVTGVWGTRICDASTSTVVASTQPATAFLLSPPAHLPFGTNITFCFVRASGTVAEVPQQVLLAAQNPRAAELNTTTLRNRQYVLITVTGEGLSPTNIRFVVLSTTCFEGAAHGDTFAVTARIGDVYTNNVSSVAFVAHIFSNLSTSFTAHLCAWYGGAWSEVRSFRVETAVPEIVVALPTAPRAGQHIVLTPTAEMPLFLSAAAVLRSTGGNSWCHNFTAVIESVAVLSNTVRSPLWRTAGLQRLCLRSDVSAGIWSDVSTAAGSLLLEILPPNPSSLWTFPSVPRIGQRVTVFFSHVVHPTAFDRVFFVNHSMFGTACDELATVGTTRPWALDAFNSSVGAVTVTDVRDALQYQSFSDSGALYVCYYSFVEDAWGYVGAGFSSLIVLPQTPFAWALASGKLVVQKAAIISLTGIVDTLTDRDTLWLVPAGRNCTSSLCPGCLALAIDNTRGNSTTRFSLAFSAAMDGNFSVCYALVNATAAMVPGVLEIATGDIQCSVQSTVWIGRRQNITMRTLPGVNTTADSLRFSFFASSSGLCNASLVSDFPSARATVVSRGITNITYSLEWPVTMNDARYTICYLHDKEYGRVCSCAQFDSRSSDCYVETIAAVPSAFSTLPKPTFVGQTLRLDVDTDSAVTQISSIVFVPYQDALSTCADAKEITFAQSSFLASVNRTRIIYSAKHNFSLGAKRYVVCAVASDGSTARIPTSESADQTLVLHSYLSLSTIPSNPMLLRAMSTIQLSLRHATTAVGSLSPADVMTLVQSPWDCNESKIDETAVAHNASVMSAVLAGDSSFSSAPLFPVVVGNSSISYVTFRNASAAWYVCYKLRGATWAVVDSAITILPPVFNGCTTRSTASSANADSGTLRALQYIPTTISGDNITLFQLLRTQDDLIRIVRGGAACHDDTASLHTAPHPYSFAVPLFTAMLLSPVSGAVKVCVQIGGQRNVSLYSPVCTLTLAQASPVIASIAGCYRTGQTLSLNATLHSTQFGASDQMWVVAGERDCVTADQLETDANPAVLVNFTTGVKFAVGVGRSVALPPITLASGVGSVRFCYRNSNSSWFTVPVDSFSVTSIGERHPVAASLPSKPQIAQYVPDTFTGDPTLFRGSASGVLPRVAATAAFDGAGSARLSQADASCIVHQSVLVQAVAAGNASTAAAISPTQSGAHVSCYRPVGCSLTDVPLPFRVFEANPAGSSVSSRSPRKGQLLNLTFFRVANETDAAQLSPGSDRAELLPSEYESCWMLDATAGTIIAGTASMTQADLMVYADPPAFSGSSTAVACYRLALNPPWSYIPHSRFTIAAANPTHFFTSLPAMAFRVTSLTLVGYNFTSGDRVKIIPEARSCTMASTPTTGTASVSNGWFTIGSASGWAPRVINGTHAVLNMSTDVEGVFSVCYRLAEDEVWTLVYGSLLVHPRNPQLLYIAPVSALEGELFTVAFTRINSSVVLDVSQEMQASDQLELIEGINVNCLIGSPTDVISVALSRSDLLPSASYFQLASGTRGVFTLCYAQWVNGVRVPLWGFPPVVIQPNPLSYSTTVPAPNANDIFGVLFYGFGLQSSADRHDEVKFVSSSLPQSDASCRTATHTSTLVQLKFSASGNVSVVSVFAKRQETLWVCYKLFGGQFHVFASPLVIGALSPVVVPSTLKNPLVDGERNAINLTFTSSGWRSGDYVFVSQSLCADIDVLVNNEEPSTLSSFAPVVTPGSVSGQMIATLVSWTAGNVSVCYRSPSASSFGLTHVLVESLSVVVGAPALMSRVSVTAQRVFTLRIIDWPAPFPLREAGEYATLVSSVDECKGPRPTSALLGETINASTSTVTISGVLASSGTYFLCSLTRTGLCASTTRDCGRLLQVVEVAEADPVQWIGSPSSTLATATQVYFAFTPLTSAFVASRPVVLLSFVSSSFTTAVTSDAVARSCMNRSSLSVALTASATERAVWLSIPNRTGTFAVCAVLGSEIATFPSQVFTVTPSAVTDAVVLADTPIVLDELPTVVSGVSLCEADRLAFVQLPNVLLSYSPTALQAACTNTTLRRVVAVPVTSGFGRNTMSFAARTNVSGVYTLCYQFLFQEGTTTWTRASLDVIRISPLVTAVAFSTTAVFAAAPFVVYLDGVSLTSGDRIAFVRRGDECLSISAAVFMVTPTSSGILANVVLQTSGPHNVCLLAAVGTSFRLEPVVLVQRRHAVSVAFVVNPVCLEAAICSTQPQLQLFDAAGAEVADVGAAIELSLVNTFGQDQSEALFGNASYTISSSGRFAFYTATVNAAGTFVMRAAVTLLGGLVLSAQTPPFSVPRNASLVTLTMSCSRSSVPRIQTVSHVPVNCTISALVPYTAAVFTVATSAGFAALVASATGIDGLPWYTYQVDVPMQNFSTNFVLVTATATDTRYPGRIVRGSPTIIQILTTPDESSVLHCTSNLTLSGITYARRGSSVPCVIQARVTVAGTTYSVIPPLSALAARYSTTSFSTPTTFAIDLSSAHVTLSGEVFFSTGLAAGDAMEVRAFVDAPDVNRAIRGSPFELVVLGAPTVASSLSCTGALSASSSFFIPGDAFFCTLLLRDASGIVFAFGSDLNVSSDRGAVSPLLNPTNTLSSNFTLRGFAPAAAGALELPTRRFQSQASNQDITFSVYAVYIPSTTVIAAATGTLVFVTSVTGAAALAAGQDAVLTLSGSGLTVLHTYQVSYIPACNGTGPLVTVRAGAVAGNILLSFTTPSQPFYLCFSPAGTSVWQLLLRGAFTNISHAGAAPTLSDDDVVLIVVGCILGGLLLLLLPFVLWLIFRPVAAPPVAYAARVNDQYIHRPVVSVTPAETPKNSYLDNPPPPGYGGELNFSSVIMDNASQNSSLNAKDEKKKRKKIDASIRKIAVMQQRDLEARSAASDLVDDDDAVPPPVLNGTRSGEQPAQSIHVVSVEEHSAVRRPYDFTSFSPPLPSAQPPSGSAPRGNQEPETAFARSNFVVAGHTSLQFATDS